MPQNETQMGADMTERPCRDDLTQPVLNGSDADMFEIYARLRAEAPLVWDEAASVWIASTHADVWSVSVDNKTFRSGGGILPLEIGIEYPSPPTMMHTDAPLHNEYRSILSPAFRPSRMRALSQQLDALADEMVGRLPLGESVDIVSSLCVPYPLYVIAALLGVPQSDWEQFFFWSEAGIPDATDMTIEERQQAMADMQAYLLGVAHERRLNPQQDLISDLATATLQGNPLSDSELLMFLDQLLIAGNETTRNLLSGSIVAMGQAPDQLAALITDRSLMPTAVEEFLRWTSPVIGFMRTAAVDTKLGSQTIAAGEPVHMLYASANRDEFVFGPDADRLRIDRNPNPHLSFGFGAHYCIGAALGRLEATSVWNALLRRASNISVDDVDVSPSTIIAGYRRADVVLHAV